MNYVKGFFRWLKKPYNDHATLKSCIEHYGAISKITRLMLIYAVIMLAFMALVMLTTRCTPQKKAINSGSLSWSPLWDTTIIINGTRYMDTALIATAINPWLEADTVIRLDTIACVYLYCDTTSKQDLPQWKKGYSVYEVRCCTDGNTSEFAIYQPVNYKIFKEYLDEKRKPVSKNIIIWMAK